MRILVDMNLSPQWVPFLQAHGIEAVHWSEIGEASSPDSEILAHAAAGGFVIFTHDLDFGTLLAASGVRSPSVIQVRTQDVLPHSLGPVVLRALEAVRPHLEQGAIVTVDLASQRIRLLPIQPR